MEEINNILLYLSLFIIGTTFGSFLNAIGIRISFVIENFYDKAENEKWDFFKTLIEEIKLLKLSNEPKRSICPICKNQLKWYHNIPIFSYIFLGGKCSYCKTKIPIVYFLSELLLGFLTVLIYYNSIQLEIPVWVTIFFILSIYLMYVCMVIDIKKRYIPDFGLLLPLPFFVLYSYYYNQENFLFIFYNSVYALIFYFSIKELLIYIYKKTGKLLIGIADIKMLSILIPIIGVLNTVWVLFLANYIALPFFVYNLWKTKKNVLDFGIFIYISFFIILYYNQELYNLLLN